MRNQSNGGGAKPRTVTLVRSDYRPSKAELEEDMRVDATFEEAVESLIQPVNIRCVPRPEAAD